MAKIIIVEDDMNLADLYQKRLVKEGYEAQIVMDRDAVAKISETKPDLVLLDIFMPNISGINILKTLRTMTGLEQVHILILTNDEKADDMETAVSLGVDGYILKAETSLEALITRVKEILT